MSKKDRMNFGKTLLDAPIKRKRTVRDNKFYLVPLQKPLVPTPFSPPPVQRPVLKPRIKSRIQAQSIALPRNRLPKKVREKVQRIQKLIDEITPYYSPEKIEKFKKDLRFTQVAEIIEKKKALKGNVANFEVTIVNKDDPSIHLADTRNIIKEKFESLLDDGKRKGLKFSITREVRMKKEVEDGTIYQEPYFICKTKTVTNKDQILEKIKLAEEEILNRIAEWISEGSQWAIDEVIHRYLKVVFYIPLRGNSFISLPKESRNSKKGLINLHNEDNKCFLWCHVRHLNPAKHNPQRITLTDKEFSKKFDYSGITFPVR